MLHPSLVPGYDTIQNCITICAVFLEKGFSEPTEHKICGNQASPQQFDAPQFDAPNSVKFGENVPTFRITAIVWAAVAVTVLADVATAQEVRRAPSMGFMGMRGKKDIFPEDDNSIEEFKRAPLMGFQGVRGKKAPSMGFMGMRGKKEEGQDFWDEEKRAPSSGFFGMRGKKAPAAGFFGMRGKKGPSSGFFGMRGKKGPSGFLGMRGKKESIDDIDSLLQYLRDSEARQDIEDMMETRAKRFADDSFQEPQSEQDFL
nr:tachykinins [Halyomorpha halys]